MKCDTRIYFIILCSLVNGHQNNTHMVAHYDKHFFHRAIYLRKRLHIRKLALLVLLINELCNL